jgi:hypothetical protein
MEVFLILSRRLEISLLYRMPVLDCLFCLFKTRYYNYKKAGLRREQPKVRSYYSRTTGSHDPVLSSFASRSWAHSAGPARVAAKCVVPCACLARSRRPCVGYNLVTSISVVLGVITSIVCQWWQKQVSWDRLSRREVPVRLVGCFVFDLSIPTTAGDRQSFAETCDWMLGLIRK